MGWLITFHVLDLEKSFVYVKYKARLGLQNALSIVLIGLVLKEILQIKRSRCGDPFTTLIVASLILLYVITILS